MTDLWTMLESANWGRRTDYKEIGSEWEKHYSQKEIKAAETFCKERRQELVASLEQHAEDRTGNRHGYYGLSDDSFWDLTAHIVGLGRKTFEEIRKDPEQAKKMADERSFTENFQYIFHYTGHKESMTGSQRAG